MPAYMIATMTIHDPETYKKYTDRTPALVARHQGEFLTRGDAVTTLEGAPFLERMVIIRFPDKAHAEALFSDPEYQEAAKYRRAASVARFTLQDRPANS